MVYNRQKSKMKKVKLYLTLGLFVCSLPCFTACEPDEVDAFAEGYRYGYENSSSWEAQPTDSEALETETMNPENVK